MHHKSAFTQNQLIAVLLIFVIATTSFWISVFVSIPIVLWNNFQKILFTLGLFGYVYVIALLLLYYILYVFDWFAKSKKGFIWLVVVILGLVYSLCDGLTEKSTLVFLRDTGLIGLIILGLPCLQKVSSKKVGNTKKKIENDC